MCGFGLTALLTWLLCSLLQIVMFAGATNFNQDLNGWDVSSGRDFVSLGWILLICSFLLEDVWFWNDSITDLATVLIAADCYVCRCYQL